MPEMHLKNTKYKERIQKFKETGDSRYIYQNELQKACFEYDMIDVGFKDLTRRTVSDKILRDKALILLKIRNMMDIKEVLLQWSIKFLIKKFLAVVLKIKLFLIKN